jgi:hypothetical protein
MVGGFLYIALVDLLPELRPVEARKDESPLVHLILQNLGLLTGMYIKIIWPVKLFIICDDLCAYILLSI